MQDDVLSDKYSNKDNLRGMSGIPSPKSSYHAAYDLGNNYD